MSQWGRLLPASRSRGAAVGPPWGLPHGPQAVPPPPQHRFSAVVHFAGLKAVGESVQQPLEYYRVNLTGTIRLLEVRQRHVAGLGAESAASAAAGALPQAMKAHGVKNIVFSSSATVYGDPKYLPLDENHPVGGCTNPYGKSKYFIEEMIRDLCKADKVRSCCREPGAGTQGVSTPKGAGAGAARRPAAPSVRCPRTGTPCSCATSTLSVPTSPA